MRECLDRYRIRQRVVFATEATPLTDGGHGLRLTAEGFPSDLTTTPPRCTNMLAFGPILD